MQPTGQRWCAAGDLFALRQPSGRAFALPPHEREPVSWGVFNASKAVLLRTQQQDRRPRCGSP